MNTQTIVKLVIEVMKRKIRTRLRACFSCFGLVALTLVSPNLWGADCGPTCGGTDAIITYRGKQISVAKYLEATKLKDSDKNKLYKLIELRLKELRDGGFPPEFVDQLEDQFQALTWYKLDRSVDQLPYALTHYDKQKNSNIVHDMWQTADSKLVFIESKFYKRPKADQADAVIHELSRGIVNDGKTMNTNFTEMSIYNLDTLLTKRPLPPKEQIRDILIANGFVVEHLQALARKSTAITDPVNIPVELAKPISLGDARKAVFGCLAGEKDGSLFKQMFDQAYVGKERLVDCAKLKYPLEVRIESKRIKFQNSEECRQELMGPIPYFVEYGGELIPSILPLSTTTYNPFRRKLSSMDETLEIDDYSSRANSQRTAIFFLNRQEGSQRFVIQTRSFHLTSGGSSTDHSGSFVPVIDLPQLSYEVANPLDTVTDAWGHVNEARMLKTITITADRSTLEGSGALELKTADAMGIVIPAKINVPAYSNCLKRELENASANASNENIGSANVVTSPSSAAKAVVVPAASADVGDKNAPGAVNLESSVAPN